MSSSKTQKTQNTPSQLAAQEVRGLATSKETTAQLILAQRNIFYREISDSLQAYALEVAKYVSAPSASNLVARQHKQELLKLIWEAMWVREKITGFGEFNGIEN